MVTRGRKPYKAILEEFTKTHLRAGMVPFAAGWNSAMKYTRLVLVNNKTPLEAEQEVIKSSDVIKEEKKYAYEVNWRILLYSLIFWCLVGGAFNAGFRADLIEFGWILCCSLLFFLYIREDILLYFKSKRVCRSMVGPEPSNEKEESS